MGEHEPFRCAPDESAGVRDDVIVEARARVLRALQGGATPDESMAAFEALDTLVALVPGHVARVKSEGWEPSDVEIYGAGCK